MKKNILISGAIVCSLLLLSGCSSKSTAIKDFGCKQENVNAPDWTCIPNVEGFYSGVGIAEKSKLGHSFMRKEAIANGRSDLAQQIQTQVKDKVESFTRSTGVGENEVVDKVVTAVSKQVAKVDLSGSKVIDTWISPSGALYFLVVVDANSVNNTVKNAVNSSFKNNDALWQQFQSKQSLESLEKEFPTN